MSKITPEKFYKIHSWAKFSTLEEAVSLMLSVTLAISFLMRVAYAYLTLMLSVTYVERCLCCHAESPPTLRTTI